MTGRPQGSKNTKIHVWSIEEKEYLKRITPGHHYSEIQQLVNDKFKLELSMNQIKGAIKRNSLKTGFTGKFEKGSIPVNKGVKGVIYEGCKGTWFKKGNIPKNHRAVGSERITKDGYAEIKIAEPNKWRLKHLVIWEKENGPVPKGHAVIFSDGDKTNIDIRNLMLITRHQLLVMNKNKLIKNDAEITKTGTIIADLLIKINERKKSEEGGIDG